MISIKIESCEIEKITTRGYRSKSALKLNANGSGIGMYRIQKTLKLNEAYLTIIPRVNTYNKKVGGIDYEGNEFRITFQNQVDWFRKY